MDGSEYLLEFYRVGEYVKVSAVDVATLREVCVVLPAKGLTQKEMETMAIKRLEYVLKKESAD